MLAELVETGLATEKQRQANFLQLAEAFRAAKDPAEVKRLGDLMGQMIFR